MKTMILLMALPFCASAGLIHGIVSGPYTTELTGPKDCSATATTTVVAGFAISTDGAACLPVMGWSFLDNGDWYGIPAVGDSSGTTTITIDLGQTYSSVWGFVDDYSDCSSSNDGCITFGNDPTIAVLDVNKNVLESYDIAGLITGSQSGDIDFLAGDTVGVSRSTQDIRYLQIGGDLIAIADISVGSPEPGTIALIGLGLAGVSLIRRRRPAV